MERTILHCDCNSYFASVECIGRPELKTVPMAVCGDPKNRHGIILAKNELAKRYGVQTAEAIWQAKRKCPNLILVTPHHQKYEEYCESVDSGDLPPVQDFSDEPDDDFMFDISPVVEKIKEMQQVNE